MAVNGPRLLAALLWAGVGLVTPFATAVAFGQVTDVEVKAAFLYNFAKYTQWPTLGEPPDTFEIAVLGVDPFGAVLDQIVRGKTVHDRPVVVRRIARPEELGQARILYVSDSEADLLPRILQQAEGAAVLTVGEMSRFATRGGVIQLRTESGRVRLDLNLEAAERARLRISSELAKIARIVGRRPGA